MSTCLALVRTSDVFVENFRPGTMERFQLGYDAMRKVRPDIIYCSISGFGQTGPMSHRPALDLMVQAVSGLMSLTGEQDGRPMKAAAPVADVMGGLVGRDRDHGRADAAPAHRRRPLSRHQHARRPDRHDGPGGGDRRHERKGAAADRQCASAGVAL